MRLVALMATLASGGGGGGGGGGGPTPSITFNPVGGVFSNGTTNVTITAANCSKIRWKLDAGSWTTVNSLSTVVAITINTNTATVLYADGLDSNNNVVVSRNAEYDGAGHL